MRDMSGQNQAVVCHTESGSEVCSKFIQVKSSYFNCVKRFLPKRVNIHGNKRLSISLCVRAMHQNWDYGETFIFSQTQDLAETRKWENSVVKTLALYTWTYGLNDTPDYFNTRMSYCVYLLEDIWQVSVRTVSFLILTGFPPPSLPFTFVQGIVSLLDKPCSITEVVPPQKTQK